MKIGIFSDVTVYNPPFPSGVSRFFREITTQLAKRGHKVTIFEPRVNSNQPKVKNIKKNITAHRCFALKFTNYADYPICLPFREIFFGISDELDIVHANHAGMGSFAAVASWKRRIPRVISYHTPIIHYLNYMPLPLFFLRSAWLVNFLVRSAYKRHILNIVPTQGVKNELVKRGFKGPFGFFPTCLDLQSLPKPSSKHLDAFRDRYSLNGKKVILFVGRMSPEKGVDQILHLIPPVIKKVPTAHFLMVGTGPFLELYRKRANNSDLAGHVTFTGYLSDFDLFSAISISDVGLNFSNIAQIFDMAMLEYWNYGLPLVVRKAMGIEEVVQDNENGLLFNTLIEAKDKILSLLTNAELAAKIRTNCKRTVEEKYDIRKKIVQLEKLYAYGAKIYYGYFRKKGYFK